MFYSYILLLFPLPNTLREMNFNVIGRFDQVLKGDSLFFYWVIVVGLFFSIVIALWSLIDICWGIDTFGTVRRLALGVINSGISVVFFWCYDFYYMSFAWDFLIKFLYITCWHSSMWNYDSPFLFKSWDI